MAPEIVSDAAQRLAKGLGSINFDTLDQNDTTEPATAILLNIFTILSLAYYI